MKTNESKEKAFDNHVSELSRSIKERTQLHKDAKQQLTATTDAFVTINTKRKEMEALVTSNAREIHSLLKEYFDLVDAGWENWIPDLIQRSEIGDQCACAALNDQWKTLPAREHFDLTDAQWEKLLEHCSEPVMRVGTLSEIIDKLESGKLKIKGVGTSLVENIKDQFDKFWEKMK